MSLSPVLALLRAHGERSLDPREEAAVRRAIALVEAHPDSLLRSCAPGHLTGSAWIVDPSRARTLLTHHRKLGKWLQLGGHADGEGDLLAVARREAREESGLATLRPLSAAIFDFDSHRIPARGAEPEHEHWDLRFFFEADPAEPLLLSRRESRELAWVPLEGVAALNPEESLARLVRKTMISRADPAGPAAGR